MQALFKAIGWLLVLAIVMLSVVPPSERPVTGAPSNLEHLGVYLLTGIAFGIGYCERPARVGLALVVFSGLIEAVQVWVPGRHARLSDFLVDGAAACAGVAACAIAERLRRRRAG
jgi:VanZ family protein